MTLLPSVILMFGFLVAGVIWFLPSDPAQTVDPAGQLSTPMPLAPVPTYGRLTSHAPPGETAWQRPRDGGEAARGPTVGASEPAALHRRLPDLIFGVVAFNGRVDRQPYHVGLRRWVQSVRDHTDEAHSELVIFTGSGEGSLMADRKMAHYLRSASVGIEEFDYRDNPTRVAHTEPRRHVWCVMRNRWFAISRFLEPRGGHYRYVLMSDTRDALLQADPFAWAPALRGSGPVLDERTVIFSGEGSGKVSTLRQSKKGVPRTLNCARDTSEPERAALLNTEPLNAGVTVGGAAAFANFSRAMTHVIRHVTTLTCLDVKDCTDQGLYNLLVYVYWQRYLPHARKLILPMEQALSYTLGHKRKCCKVDESGRLLNDEDRVPPVVHQFAKGMAGRSLPRTRFWRKVVQKR
jgi:hypothetical protein